MSRLLRKFFHTDFRYFFKGAFWLVLLRGVSASSSFLLAMLFARFLTKEAYGEYRFVLASAGTIGAISLTGFGNAVISAVARRDEGTARAAFKIQLLWGLLIFLGAAGVAAYYARIGQPELAWAFVVVALVLPLSAAFGLYESVLKGRSEFKKVATYGVSQKLCRDLGIGLTVVLSAQLLPLVVATFVVPSILTGIFCYKVLSSVPAKYKRVDRKALSYGVKMSVFRVFSFVANYGDSLVVTWLFGMVPLAIYTFAKTMPDSLRAFLSTVQPMILVKFSKQKHAQIASNIVRGFTFMTLFSAGLVVVYHYLAPYLFQWFFPQYMESVELSRTYSLILLLSGNYLASVAFHAKLNAKRQIVAGVAIQIVRYASYLIVFFNRTMEGMVYAKILGELLATIVSFGVFFYRPAKS